MHTDAIRYVALSLASEGNCAALQVYYAQNIDVLQDVILDILLYVPETVPLDDYQLILDNYKAESIQTNDLDTPIEVLDIDTSARIVRNVMDKFELRNLSLDEFAEERTRKIDQSCGILSEALRLLKRYGACSAWCDGIVRPLCTLLEVNVMMSLQELEHVSALEIVHFLDSATSEESLHLLVEEVLLPLVIYRNLHGDVAKQIRAYIMTETLPRILEIASVLLQSSADDILKEQLASGAMIACYKSSQDIAAARQILAILRNSIPSSDRALPSLPVSKDEFFDQLVSAPADRSFATPSTTTFDFLAEILDGLDCMGSMTHALTAKLGSISEQRNELTRLLNTARSSTSLRDLRLTLLNKLPFSKISTVELDSSLLRSMLLSGHADLAKRTYVTTSPRPLASKVVEGCILGCFTELFDNATSINRKDLNQASQVLGVIHPKHTNDEIRRSQLLIDTIIELSAYKGAHRYLPIQLRVINANGVLDFFSCILQEGTNYKKHFRLLGAFQNLSLARQLDLEEDRFKELVINAALASDDLAAAIAIVESIEVDTDEIKESDSWKLFYLVCKYPTESPDMLDKQFELLSLAAVLCPVGNLFEITELYTRLAANRKELQGSTGVIQPHGTMEPSTVSKSSETIAMPEWKLFEAAQAASRTARQYLPKTQSADGARVRKRDQLAGLVGVSAQAVESKFTSGLGWLIGADQSE